eukprot:754187-Hanusia_phi.AAC.1
MAGEVETMRSSLVSRALQMLPTCSYLFQYLGLMLTCLVAVQGLHVPSSASPSGLADTRQRPILAAKGGNLKHATVKSAQGLMPLRGGGEQDVTGFIFYLFKAIVGSGVLSLSSSVARFTNNPKMLAPALVAGVRRVSEGTRAQEAWAKSISTATAWIPGMACTSQTMVSAFGGLEGCLRDDQVACICYSIIIGDLSNDLMKSLGVRGWAAERNNLLAAISAVGPLTCGVVADP